jgi:hypothetical protein
MYEKTYGTKYEATKNLRRPEIAKLIREDIKAAVKSGELPKGKYSVRTESYSGGGSINVTFSALVGIPVHNVESLRWRTENPHASFGSEPANVRERYSPELLAVIKKLEAIHGAYNYDGSDVMTDYFDVRYYGSVSIDWEWEAATKEIEIAKIVEPAKPKLVLVKSEPESEHVSFLAHLGAI